MFAARLTAAVGVLGLTAQPEYVTPPPIPCAVVTSPREARPLVTVTIWQPSIVAPPPKLFAQTQAL